MPLGVFTEITWKCNTIQLEPGDSLVLYTDGITDAANSDDQFYGLERFEEAIKTHREKPAKALRDALLGEVHAWMGRSPQFDDITLLVVERESTKDSSV